MLKILMKLAGAVMILAAIASCKKDEKEDFGVPNIGVNTSSVNFSEAEGQQTVKILSSRDWTADITFTEEVEEPWLVVSPVSGSASNDSVDVVFSVLANSAEDRSASVTFNAGAVSANVTVFQKGEIAKEYTPISDVRALWTGESETVSITIEGTISGTVISNVDLNNSSSKRNIIIQDETAGIMLRLEKDEESFKRGDVIELDVNGLSLEQYAGLLQINNVPNADVRKVRSDAMPEAKVISAAELMTGDYESQYVAVQDVQVVESDLGKTFSMSDSEGTSINIESRTGERFVIRTSQYATELAKVKVPEGSGTLKGIAQCFYETMQIVLSSTEDYADMQGERFESAEPEGGVIGDYNTWSKVGPLASFSDDFSSVASANQQYINDNWLFYSNAGTNVNDGFKTGTYDSDKYIQIAPYNASVDEVVAFALPPKANMTEANPKTFSFRKALYHLDDGGDDSKMEVVVSTNFTGDFTSATWTLVKDVSFPEGAERNQWIEEKIDLSDYASESALCIALRYTGKANTYRIDDVAFGSGENQGGGDEPEELKEVSIEEFLDAEPGDGIWYQLTGEITDIASDVYGNITIKDETGSVYIYGLTATKQTGGNDKSFGSLGLETGDIVTLATLRDEFGGEPQGGGSQNPAYYISHEEGQGGGDEPDDPTVKEVTIEEFIAAEVSDNVWYQLTGTILSIDNDYYGNITIQDETGSVYVYGLTKTKVDKNDNSFSSIGLSEGDIVTLAGTRTSYNDQPQVGGPAYYISHEEGELPDDPALIEGTAGDGVYEGNIDLSQPSAVSTDDKCVASTFVIDGEEYIGMKLGTSKAAGSYSFNLGMTGSATLTMYAVAWNNNKTHAKVKISGGGTINGFSEVELDCQTNAGFSNNEPFTIEFGSNDFYTMNIEGATSSTVITVTTEGMSKTRVGFLGVNVK